MPTKDEVKSTSSGRGLTPKQEKFCQLYIELGNASEAYRQAYNCSKMSEESIKVNASKLLNENTNITLTIETLRKKHQQRHNITVDTLLTKFERIYNEAMERDIPNFTGAVNALAWQAKILGLDSPLTVDLRKAQLRKLEQEITHKADSDPIQFIQEFD